jgi:hypothetical protein
MVFGEKIFLNTKEHKGNEGGMIDDCVGLLSIITSDGQKNRHVAPLNKPLYPL